MYFTSKFNALGNPFVGLVSHPGWGGGNTLNDFMLQELGICADLMASGS